MSLGVIPVALIIGLAVVTDVTSLIAYNATATRRRSAAADQQPADLAHPHDDAKIADTGHAPTKTHTRPQS